MMPEPMKKTVDEIKVIAIREYEIKGVHYIVKAALSDNATETVKTKIQRLIQNDIEKNGA